ncbi:hypothetical protein D8I35_15500 [Corticibacter populi]|uniref:2Fe-2S ferredoxin-type domain-containing protein n=1 Tax=Corticibacter populi TaxID=1550736 RepID=A0A3M6QMM8_9BURK|nr:2Fe-2S iron-sulfur cluster-binding protein [Corticibacter populi]RMX04205.1 hypothetical protein D8I35_15500 [Corticibacter populi]RZS33232.1 ferredoxin [Corticibacter populi]
MTTEIHFEGRCVHPQAGETVLDALLRVGIDTPFSCKGGSCHTCMLHCTDGPIPEKAQRGLSERLRQLGYFLPCRCVTEHSLRIEPRQAKDMVTRCMLVEVDGHASGSLRIQFEPMTALDYRMGQSLRLVDGSAPEQEPLLMLTSDPATSPVAEARWVLQAGQTVPDSLAPSAEFGLEFEVRGPFNLDYQDLPEQRPAPPADPALWQALEDGRKARAILDAFYAKVYADTLLAPFFAGVTAERAASKQYNFLQQLMTGEKVYWGESPRNTHHWMVIPHSLFDHRQALMIETLREHGLDDGQIARWTRFEEYFRADIVKDHEWPKKIGDQIYSTEGFERETLLEATLCDQCGAEVSAGTEVLYHRRTGLISCPRCAGH